MVGDTSAQPVYAYLALSGVLLGVWLVLYLATRAVRREMVEVSLGTMLLGLTEPLFVPEYWNPPTLLNVARRTGFDLERAILLAPTPLNPIYAAALALVGGFFATLKCRPDLWLKMLVSGRLHLRPVLAECLYEHITWRLPRPAPLAAPDQRAPGRRGRQRGDLRAPGRLLLARPSLGRGAG